MGGRTDLLRALAIRQFGALFFFLSVRSSAKQAFSRFPAWAAFLSIETLFLNCLRPAVGAFDACQENGAWGGRALARG